MAFGDILFGLMGQSNPSIDLARGLGQFAGQPGSNAGPVPGSGAGAAAPALALQGAQANAAAPPPQMVQAANNQQPQPQAFQSPPDLASLYLKVLQRQQANQMINSGLGLIAGYFEHRPGGNAQIQNTMNNMSTGMFSGGGAGGLGDIAKLIDTQRQLQMQSYMMSHIQEGAKAMGISPQEYLTAYMTGKLGDVQQKILEERILEASPKYKSDVAEAQARTALTGAQTGAIPSEIALKQAQAGAIPTETKLKQAQTAAIPSDVELKQAQAAKARAEATAPTEALRNYNFAMSQLPEGQPKPTFDEWQAKTAGMKEAATQTNLLQTQQKMSAQAALPEAVVKIREQLKQADDILNDPALSNLTGIGGTHFGKYISTFPGTHGADLQAKIDQLTGATGVAAVESLKGVGRILGTEFEEGDKAQSRLHDQDVTTKAYIEAIKDYANKLRSQLGIVTQKAGLPVPQDLQQWIPDASGKVPGLETKSDEELMKKYLK